MMLTTKSRYAVMAVVDIALQGSGKPVKLAEIAERQEIALNYLEQIFSLLKQAEIVNAVKGPGGGYLLGREVSEVKIADIIDAVEESVEMTRCTTHGTRKGCLPDSSRCATHDIWEGLTDHIREYLSGITLADICKAQKAKAKKFDFINP